MSHPSKKITFADGIVLLILIIVTVAVAFAVYSRKSGGAYFTITTPDGCESYSLSDEREFSVKSNGITLSVKVSNGAVYVTESDCPDGICVHHGAISKSGDPIVCIPARVVIEIIDGGGERDEDFTVG